jgi:dihydropyrimidinase
MSILIRGGTVVNHDYSRRADVLIEGDKIAAVGDKLDTPGKADVIDAGGCYVMPGGIDPHTHMELLFMGTVSADDFESGTNAALSGGTTMIVDMCIPAPGESMLAAYQSWRHKSEKAATDYSYHMAVTGWSKQIWEEMETVVKTIPFSAVRGWARSPWCTPRTAMWCIACSRISWPAASPVPRAIPIRVRPRSKARRSTAPS